MKRPIRVLHLVHDANRSGVPAVASSIIRAADASRVVPAAVFAYDGVYVSELRRDGYEVYYMKRRVPLLWRLNRFLMGVWVAAIARRFDVIHVHSTALALTAWVVKLFGNRVVYHLHEKPGPPGFFTRRAIMAADRVVFCARNCEEFYARHLARQGQVILNAIALPAEPASPVPGRMKIVMLGSLNRNKGQHLLLQAFRALNRDDVELCFYGAFGISAYGYVKKLLQDVRAWGLEGQVFFPGPTTNAEAVYREATLVVHSSLQECLSISVLEALSYGVPVIANAIVGMDEIIENGYNGYLVEAGNVAMLTERIATLLDDAGLRARIAAAGRKSVADRFSIDLRTAEFENLYSGMLDIPAVDA